MKSIFFLFLFFGLLLSVKTNAEGYDIRIHVAPMANKEVILANYFEGKVYACDTAKLDARGEGYFRNSRKKLARGMYILLFSPSNYFDLIIGDDQNFSVKTDTVNYLQTMQFEGSPENTAFLEFQKFMTSQNQKMQKLREEYEKHPEKDSETVRRLYTEKFNQADKEVRAYVAGLNRQYPGSAVVTFVNFTLSPEVPDFSAQVPQDTKDRDMEIRRKTFYYSKDHYWDNTNFTDSMLIRTPVFKSKLDEYFKNWVIVHPDSLYRSCVDIIEKARPCKVMFRYLLNYCIVSAFDNKIMGMDEAFVKLGERYYMSGQVDWLDKEQLKKITDEVIKRQYNLIGQKALDLKLPSLEGGWVSLHETKAPYILLLFWEPNCGHCKKQVPLVKQEIYNRFSQYGLKVFSINTHTDKKAWEEFIEKNQLFDFINCWDPNRQSNYWTIYNVFSTPVLYLLDKDKKIIAKNLAVDQLVDMLKKEYRNQGIDIK